MNTHLKRNVMYALIVLISIIILSCASPVHAGTSVETYIKNSTVSDRFYSFHLEGDNGIIFEDRKTGCQYWFIDVRMPVVSLGCQVAAKSSDVYYITSQEAKVKEFQNKEIKQ